MAKTIKQLVFNGQTYQFHAANVNNYDDTDVKNRLTNLENYGQTLLPTSKFNDFKFDQYDPLKMTVHDNYSRITALERADYQNEAQVNAKIQAVVGAAPEALDTLEEIAAKLNDNENVVSALVSTIAGKADSATVTGIGDRVTTLEAIDHSQYLTEHQDISNLVTSSDFNTYQQFISTQFNTISTDMNDIAASVEDVCEAMTQEEYDALSTKKTGKLYLITD